MPAKKKPVIDVPADEAGHKIDPDTWVAPLFADKSPPVFAKDILSIRVFKSGRGVRDKKVDWTRVVGPDDDWEINKWLTDEIELRKHLPPGRYYIDALRVGSGHTIEGSGITLTVDEEDSEAHWEDDVKPSDESDDDDDEDDETSQGANVVTAVQSQAESAMAALLRQTQERQAQLEQRLLEMSSQRADDAVRHAQQLAETAVRHAEQRMTLSSAAQEAAVAGVMDRRQESSTLVDELRRELETTRVQHRDELRQRDRQVEEANAALRNAIMSHMAEMAAAHRKYESNADELIKDHREALRQLNRDRDEDMRAKREEWSEARRRSQQEFDAAIAMRDKRIQDLDAEVRELRAQTHKIEREKDLENINLHRKLAMAGKEDSNQFLTAALGAAADMVPKIFATKAQADAQAQQTALQAQQMQAAQEADQSRRMAMQEQQRQQYEMHQAQLRAQQQAQIRMQAEAEAAQVRNQGAESAEDASSGGVSVARQTSVETGVTSEPPLPSSADVPPEPIDSGLQIEGMQTVSEASSLAS